MSRALYISASHTHFDFLLNVVIEQDVRVDTVVRLREWEGVEGPALSGFLLGLLVSPLLSFQEDSLERRHDTRLVNGDKESGVERKVEDREAPLQNSERNQTRFTSLKYKPLAWCVSKQQYIINNYRTIHVQTYIWCSCNGLPPSKNPSRNYIKLLLTVVLVCLVISADPASLDCVGSCWVRYSSWTLWECKRPC